MLTKLGSLIGNQGLVRLLLRGKLPPTSLLGGPEGVGKRTLAWALATRENCEKPENEDFCGRCSSCFKSGQGMHPDICFYGPDKTVIPIASMREMSREAQYRPLSGNLRFFIIDQAERLTEEAANSILKILEEPPERSRFVLISALPQSLLPTILSRCQTFSFQRLARSEVTAFLQQQGVADADLRSAFSGGSLGAALTLKLEEVLSDRNLMLELLQSWRRTGSFETLYRRIEGRGLRAEIRSRERVSSLLGQLELLLYDLYYCQTGTGHRMTSVDRESELQALAGQVSLDWIQTFLYHVSRIRWELDHNVNPQMCLETLWLKSQLPILDHAGNSYG